MISSRFLSLLILLGSINSVSASMKLLGDFVPGWKDQWHERKFTRTGTRYEVVRENGNAVLVGRSNRSASGLWRMLKLDPAEFGRISWRWKIEKTIPENRFERQKKGDDYAARVFVVFEPHLLRWRTRAICYVWASVQPAGSIYPDPFSDSVAVVVVESGNQRSGKWITEEQDFAADYVTYFHQKPQKISAVAIMTDTDNTQGQATAWYDDINLISRKTHQ
jgi:hypothetical protein